VSANIAGAAGAFNLCVREGAGDVAENRARVCFELLYGRRPVPVMSPKTVHRPV
jgi:hypothetical protein